MTNEQRDLELERLRAEISALDRTLVETVNRRLALVAELKRHKEANGVAFLDPERERQLLADLVRAERRAALGAGRRGARRRRA